MKKVIFCGGCFWCTEAVFKRLKGVFNVVPGYTGGFIKNPSYNEVCMGNTGHAEGISIDYNPKIISFVELLEIFFLTHDPTTLNKQGHDVGSQYRSAVFCSDESQRKAVEKHICSLNSSKVYGNPIVTTVEILDVFYEAEDYHKDYYNQNKNEMYCQLTILPKINKLTKHYNSKLK
tara:strand:- start:1687 stop:2214 length:528 start_codon:yes stop_codon:yes gene_type:complete